MPSITVSVPADLKKEIDTFQTINWSAVARESIIKELEKQKFLREFTNDSELTEKDAVRLGRELKARVAKRLRESRR